MHYALKEFARLQRDSPDPCILPSSGEHGRGCAPPCGAPLGPGLSKGHNCTRATTTFYTGGSLVAIKRPVASTSALRNEEPPEAERSAIIEFSRKSRQRLRLDLARVDQRTCGRPLFISLTYPNEFPLDAATFKGHLRAIGERLRRSFPHAGFHWKLEFQKRGAAHFHLIGWNLPSDREQLRVLREWFAFAWYEVVGSGVWKHFCAGTSVEVIRSQFGIMRYVGPYVAKDDQSMPGAKVGRYWGHIARAQIPYAESVQQLRSPAESLLDWRTARRYMRALNRARRSRFVDVSLGRTNSLFDGSARSLRKQAPQLAFWARLPRKLRINSNESINLFCNAEFWLGAMTKLHAANACASSPRRLRSRTSRPVLSVGERERQTAGESVT